MISNYITRNRIKKIKDDLHVLGKKKVEVQLFLRSLGLSHNKKSNPQNIDPFIKVRRDAAILEMNAIEDKTGPLKAELKNLQRDEDAQRNKALMTIFREIFSVEQLKEIEIEAQNRMIGEENKALTFSFRRHEEFKKDFYKYRMLAQEHLEKMIEFRIMLTGLIDKGCEQFGQGEFLKFISPLNNLIIPVNELKKIKIKHLL